VWPGRETDEYKTLMTYIKNTEQGVLRGKFITNIYNLQRKGEPERYHTRHTHETHTTHADRTRHDTHDTRFQKWEDLHNHQLLFHGSHLANFVGTQSANTT
jgi:hypothetical protein